MDKREKPRRTEVGRSPGYIPRPPSRADVERVSEQQGMIADEWAPAPEARDRKPGGAKDEPG